MRIAILYATREGQTRRIAEHLARELRAHGSDADVSDLASTVGDPLAGCDAVVLAGSVHIGKHERELVRFVRAHLERLERLPHAFVSVSLTQAGIERPDADAGRHARAVASLAKVLVDFQRQTGWRPRRIFPVAGALVYRRYNPIIRFVMKQISRMAGGDTDTSRDYEYTDWARLSRFAGEFAESLAPLPVEPPSAPALH
jgi:menaquinone-dependent protoporphyrinogen oxidase